MNTMNTCNGTNHSPFQTIREALDAAPAEWLARLDDSNLHVARSADQQLCFELALDANCPLLRGYVIGLTLNN